MGCEVVSVYQDQVFGKIGYPQQLLNDLAQRDLQPPTKLKILKSQQFKNKIKSLYGYNMSFTASNLQSIIINQQQHLLYNSLNTIVLYNLHTKQQKILPHEDQILSLSLQSKYLATAIVNGKITLWDLQLLEVKLHLSIPKMQQTNQYINISAISLTKKFIIVCDTCQPSNYIHAFDIQTGKLLASQMLLSLQPTFRGTSFGDHHLVTVGADGVWFCKYSLIQNKFMITKGIFGKFPRTSMTCITKVGGQYIITGGVDGYIFIWSNQYQCKAVYRIFDYCITSIIINKNNIIVSGIQNKTKCLKYSLLKHIKQDDKQAPPVIQMQFTILANYQTLSPVQNMAFAKLNTDFCYLQTRNGQLISKIIPYSQIHQIRKIPLEQSSVSYLYIKTFKKNHLFRKTLIQFQYFQKGQDLQSLSDSQGQLFLWAVSYLQKSDKVKKSNFCLIKLRIQDIKKFNKQKVSYYKNLQISLQSKHIIQKKIFKRSPFGFSADLHHICYVTKNNKQNHIYNNDSKKKSIKTKELIQESEEDILQVKIPKLLAFECSQTILSDQLASQNRKQFFIQSSNFSKDQIISIQYLKIQKNKNNSKIQNQHKIILLIVEQNNNMIVFSAEKQGYSQIAFIESVDKLKLQSEMNEERNKNKINIKQICQIYFDLQLQKWVQYNESLSYYKIVQKLNLPLKWETIKHTHNSTIDNYYFSQNYQLLTVGNGKIIQWNLNK